MRTFWLTMVVLLGAGAVDAQQLFLGAGVGTSWEFDPPALPSKSTYHSSDAVSSAFLAMRLDEDTQLRVRVANLPFQAPRSAASGPVEAWPGRLRAMTVGVDYFMTGVVGNVVFSGGVGGYQLDLKAAHPPAGMEATRFGWYLGVGEWFRFSRHLQGTLEFTMDRADQVGKPTVVTAAIGLAYGF
ncbi:MAG: hypothetical protein ACM3O7_05100 [Acidobacteriota bacterium]